MNYNDIWTAQPFDMISMTKQINKDEFVPNFFENELDWDIDTSLTKDFGLDIEENSVKLLPILDRTAPLPSAQRTTRDSKRIQIQRWGATESVLNDEVIGVRETGTMNMRTLESLAAQKLKRINDSIQATTQWAMKCALDGKVVDPIDGSIVYNLHTVLGTTQTVVNFDFSDATIDFNIWLGAAKRWIEDTMGAYQLQVTRYTYMCGRNQYRALLARPDVKAMFTDYQVKTSTLRYLQADRDIPGGFVMADNVYVIDAGQARRAVYDNTGAFIGNDGYISDNDAYLVPNAVNNGRRMFGPSTLSQFMGNVQPIYVAQKPREWNDGIDLRGETFQINYFARPDLNLLVHGQNIHVPTIALFPAQTPAGVGKTPTTPGK